MNSKDEFYPESTPNTAELYVKDSPKTDKPDKTPVELQHITILFNRFRFITTRECLINNDSVVFDRMLNKLKLVLNKQEIELLQIYATYLYENLFPENSEGVICPSSSR